MGNRIHFASTAVSHTSKLDLTAGYRASNKTGSFLYNYFVTGEGYKDIFSISCDTVKALSTMERLCRFRNSS